MCVPCFCRIFRPEFKLHCCTVKSELSTTSTCSLLLYVYSTSDKLDVSGQRINTLRRSIWDSCVKGAAILSNWTITIWNTLRTKAMGFVSRAAKYLAGEKRCWNEQKLCLHLLTIREYVREIDFSIYSDNVFSLNVRTARARSPAAIFTHGFHD